MKMKNSIFLLTIFFVGFISLQSAAQWQLALDSCYSWSIAKKDTSVLAGKSNGIYFSDISGTRWTFKNCPASYVRSIVVKDSIIFITSDFDGVFKSLDNGLTWISINSGISNPAQAWSITCNDSLLLLGTSSSFAGDTASLYISSDDGAMWKKVYSLGTTEVFYSFAVSENEVFVGVLPSGLFYSNDKGLTWTLRNPGIAAKHIALSEPNLLAESQAVPVEHTFQTIKESRGQMYCQSNMVTALPLSIIILLPEIQTAFTIQPTMATHG